MRRLTAVLIVFGGLTVAPGIWAFQDPCQDEGKRAIDGLVERWTWESFWDGGTSGFQYQPRAKATVEIFWNTDLIGMCPLGLGTCTAYERNGARLGQFAMADPVRTTDLHQATEGFLRRLSEPRVIRQSNTRKPDSEGRFERGGTAVSIPTPAPEVVVQRNASGLQTCALTDRSFPALGLPRPIRDKVTPDNLSAFEQWLKGRLHPGPAGTKSEYVIPYYSLDDPMVYVLVRVNGKTESVIFVVPMPDGTGWRIGGHFDPKESPTQVQRLEPLILSAKMMWSFADRAVKPDRYAMPASGRRGSRTGDHFGRRSGETNGRNLEPDSGRRSSCRRSPRRTVARWRQ